MWGPWHGGRSPGALGLDPQSHLLGVGGVGECLKVCLLPRTIPTVDMEGGLFLQV